MDGRWGSAVSPSGRRRRASVMTAAGRRADGGRCRSSPCSVPVSSGAPTWGRSDCWTDLEVIARWPMTPRHLVDAGIAGKGEQLWPRRAKPRPHGPPDRRVPGAAIRGVRCREAAPGRRSDLHWRPWCASPPHVGHLASSVQYRLALSPSTSAVPSTTRQVPLTNQASSLARNTAAAATSCGWAARTLGDFVAM